MTKITSIYGDTDDYQMRHCDPCEMPQALRDTDDPSYSELKHMIIESRHCAGNEAEIEQMRLAWEARGRGEMFDTAQKCIRCAEGMCLIIEGRETGWRVGGDLAVE